MAENKKREKILEYLKAGTPPARIAGFKEINCNRSYVYAILKQAIENGILVKDDLTFANWAGETKKWQTTYKATGRKPLENHRGSSTHYIRLYFEILSPLKKTPEGKQWSSSGTDFIFFDKVEGDLRVSFRICNMKELVATIEMPILMTDQNLDDVAIERGLQCSAWFTRNYGGSLSLPQQKEHFHYAIPEKDQEIVEWIEKIGHFEKGDEWWDKSRGFVEYETTDERKLKVKANIVDVVMGLDDRLTRLEKNIEKLSTSIERISNLLERPTLPVSDGREVA